MYPIKNIYIHFQNSFDALYSTLENKVTRKEYYQGAKKIHRGIYSHFISVKSNKKNIRGKFIKRPNYNYDFEYFFCNEQLLGYIAYSNNLPNLFGFVKHYDNYELTLEYKNINVCPTLVNFSIKETINDLTNKVIYFSNIRPSTDYVDCVSISVEKYYYQDNLLTHSYFKKYIDNFKTDPTINTLYQYKLTDKNQLKISKTIDLNNIDNLCILKRDYIKDFSSEIDLKYYKLLDKGITIFNNYTEYFESFFDDLFSNTKTIKYGTDTDLLYKYLSQTTLLTNMLSNDHKLVKVHYDKNHKIIGFEEHNEYLFDDDKTLFGNNFTFIIEDIENIKLMRFINYDHKWLIDRIQNLIYRGDLLVKYETYSIFNQMGKEITNETFKYDGYNQICGIDVDCFNRNIGFAFIKKKITYHDDDNIIKLKCINDYYL